MQLFIVFELQVRVFIIGSFIYHACTNRHKWMKPKTMLILNNFHLERKIPRFSMRRENDKLASDDKLRWPKEAVAG